jgi:hypothetical protein
MSGFFLKGALIQLMPTFLVPLPNLIIFQFNPETMRHSWSQPLPRGAGGAGQGSSGQSDPQAVSGAPTESYSFTLYMDANEMITSGSETQKDLAIVTGVASRLAALEMLQYPLPPSGTSLAGQLIGTVGASASVGGAGASVGGAAGGGQQTPTAVPTSQVAAALFVWGPERIVPVRLTTLEVTETLYDEILNPVHAQADVTLQVLTPPEIKGITPKAVKFIANAAYWYTQGERQVLAVADTAESVIGLLPIKGI